MTAENQISRPLDWRDPSFFEIPYEKRVFRWEKQNTDDKDQDSQDIKAKLDANVPNP